jgi:hypothetical protein
MLPLAEKPVPVERCRPAPHLVLAVFLSQPIPSLLVAFLLSHQYFRYIVTTTEVLSQLAPLQLRPKDVL